MDFLYLIFNKVLLFIGGKFQNAWFSRAGFKKVNFSSAVVLGELDPSESDLVFKD